MPFLVPILVELGLNIVLAEIAAAVISTLVSIGLTYLAGLLLRPSLNAESQQQVIKQPVPPRRRYYGDVKVGGVWALLRNEDSVLYQVILICQGVIDSFITHWFGEEELTLDGSGTVTVPTRFQRSGVNYANVKGYLGTDTQTADSVLVANVSGWTTDHQLLGIAYVRTSLLSPPAEGFTKIYPSGLQPYNTRIHASRVWDPRDGGQDPDDPSTWTWTQNGVLIVLDYLWHADGMRLPRSLIEAAIDVWKAEADRADEDVDLDGGGTEKRWRLSGGYDLSSSPKQVLPLMLVPMDAQLYLRGDGAIVIRTGRYEEPSVTIEDRHVYEYKGFTRARHPGELKNEIRATYVAPENDFVPQEADPFQNQASIDIDGLQSMSLDLTWVPSHSQARRRMKPELYRQNPAWSGQLVLTAYGLKLSDQRFFRLNLAELGIVAEVFEILRWSFNAIAGQFVVDVVSMPSEAWEWDPATDEGTPPEEGSGGGEMPTLDDPTGLAATPSAFGAGGKFTASVDDPGDPLIVTEFDWSFADADDWHAFTTDGTSSNGYTAITGLLGTDDYDIRARHVKFGATASNYVMIEDVNQPFET